MKKTNQLRRKSSLNICIRLFKYLFQSCINAGIGSGQVLSDTQTKIMEDLFFYLGLSEYYLNSCFQFGSDLSVLVFLPMHILLKLFFFFSPFHLILIMSQIPHEKNLIKKMYSIKFFANLI